MGHSAGACVSRFLASCYSEQSYGDEEVAESDTHWSQSTLRNLQRLREALMSCLAGEPQWGWVRAWGAARAVLSHQRHLTSKSLICQGKALSHTEQGQETTSGLSVAGTGFAHQSNHCWLKTGFPLLLQSPPVFCLLTGSPVQLPSTVPCTTHLLLGRIKSSVCQSAIAIMNIQDIQGFHKTAGLHHSSVGRVAPPSTAKTFYFCMECSNTCYNGCCSWTKGTQEDVYGLPLLCCDSHHLWQSLQIISSPSFIFLGRESNKGGSDIPSSNFPNTTPSGKRKKPKSLNPKGLEKRKKQKMETGGSFEYTREIIKRETSGRKTGKF